MSLDVYFVSDIRRSIVSNVVVAVETAIANGLGNADHLAGILTLAKGMAVNFGIPWTFVINDARLALGTGYADLLDAGNLLGASR